MTLLAEKRKVGSSTLPLTTISQPGRLPASPAFVSIQPIHLR